MNGLEIAKVAYNVLDDKKGEDIILLDVREMSPISDYILIATGTSGPHVKALFAAVERELKNSKLHCHRKAGAATGGWVVLDYFDIIIHIFSAESRAYYSIEEIWPEAPRVPLP
jgi:ribosome-associated protein